MNKKSVGIVLILYAALAGIPGVLAYFQKNNIIVQSNSVSCGSCHPDPGASTPEKCEYCHKDPKDLIPHANGGNLCFDCHVTEFEHEKSLIKE
ncbi:MAG: hypothetical protein FIB07_01755 [Candidatus Methanoperedens sp.]|nr:hypothetical protein [Candidatus Methanoperedens sp.]